MTELSKEELLAQIEDLSRQLTEVNQEKADLEILLETINEHSTYLENQIHQKNKQLRSYIQQVEKLTDAAAAVENNSFDPGNLKQVAAREDELGHLARVFTQMVQTIKTREQELEELLNAFGRFVPHEFLKFLQKQSIVDIQLGDHVSKEMAVMFTDIRSFTTFSERMTPQETFDFVNAYLRYVAPEIRGHNGFVVKFMGDGMMAVFPDGADDAVAGGIAFLKKLQEYNQKRESQGYSPIEVGMGIHVGYMMVGVVGEQDRLQGDTLSDTVNLTSRLEGLTKHYGVSMAISGEVLERLSHPEQYKVRFIDRTIVKGRSEPITAYEVLDVETELIQTLKLQTLPDFEQGFEHYRNGDLQAAQACFKQVLIANPLDKTAKLYLKRIAQLANQGIPKNWRGIWVFREK